ncbi:MAG TPA: hypothetical protein VEG32_07855 [Clostridia bacterium]|nr:hypothetical protein [Clostridia bacterium]
MSFGFQSDRKRRAISLVLILPVVLLLHGAVFGCVKMMESRQCPMKAMTGGEDCCPKPAQKNTGPRCCDADSRSVPVNRDPQAAPTPSPATVAVVTAGAIASPSSAAPLTSSSSSYVKPVFELKTDLRI